MSSFWFLERQVFCTSAPNLNQDMIKSIEAHPGLFSFEELKTLLDLKYDGGGGDLRGEYVDLLTKIKSHFVRNNL